MGGRNDKAPLPYDQRHPMILPNRGFLTRFFINDTHLATLHGGKSLTLAILRQRFWIFDGVIKSNHIIIKSENEVITSEEYLLESSNIPRFNATQLHDVYEQSHDWRAKMEINNIMTNLNNSIQHQKVLHQI